MKGFLKVPVVRVLCGVMFRFLAAPKPSGRRARKPGIDRKPRQAYSAKQLERLENEFKVS